MSRFGPMRSFVQELRMAEKPA